MSGEDKETLEKHDRQRKKDLEQSEEEFRKTNDYNVLIKVHKAACDQIRNVIQPNKNANGIFLYAVAYRPPTTSFQMITKFRIGIKVETQFDGVLYDTLNMERKDELGELEDNIRVIISLDGMITLEEAYFRYDGTKSDFFVFGRYSEHNRWPPNYYDDRPPAKLCSPTTFKAYVGFLNRICIVTKVLRDEYPDAVTLKADFYTTGREELSNGVHFTWMLNEKKIYKGAVVTLDGTIPLEHDKNVLMNNVKYTTNRRQWFFYPGRGTVNIGTIASQEELKALFAKKVENKEYVYSNATDTLLRFEAIALNDRPEAGSSCSLYLP